MKKLLILLSILFLFIHCDDDNYLKGTEEGIEVSFNGVVNCENYSTLTMEDRFQSHPVKNALPDTIDGNPFYFARPYIVTFKYLEETTKCGYIVSGEGEIPTIDLQLVEILTIREK